MRGRLVLRDMHDHADVTNRALRER